MWDGVQFCDRQEIYFYFGEVELITDACQLESISGEISWYEIFKELVDVNFKEYL